MESVKQYLRSQRLLDFKLVFGGFQSPFRCLSAIVKLLEAAGQLLQLGGALMEPLAQFVHPSVQLSLFITYLQTSCFKSH